MNMNISIRYAAVLSVCLMFFLAAGCMENRKEVEQGVLERDPAFQETLNQRDSVQKELDSERAVFQKKESEIQSQIALLRDQITIFKQKKSELRALHFAALDSIKRKIYPDKRVLEQNYTEKKRLLRRKAIEARDVERDIKEIKGLVDKKDRLSLTREEIEAWNKRYASLLDHKSLADKEIAELEKEIETLGMKIKVINVK